MPPSVAWPGTPAAATDSDLLKPTKDFLQGVAVLEDASQAQTTESPFNPFSPSTTPYSLQVITAGTLAFSRQAAGIISGLGGATVILAAIKGIWFASSNSERVTFIGGAAVVLAGALVSIAIIVRSDVQARAAAQVAEYQARGRIAAEFLRTAQRARSDSAPDRYWIRRYNADEWQQIDRFEKAPNGLRAVPTSGNPVPQDQIEFLVRASHVS